MAMVSLQHFSMQEPIESQMYPSAGFGEAPAATALGANCKAGQVRHSRYRGVTWDKRDQRWRVRINCLGVQHHVGRYPQELQAARVYDRVSHLLYGEDAITNFGVASAAADNCSIPRTMLQLKERHQQWKSQQRELAQQQQQMDVTGMLHTSPSAVAAAAAAAAAVPFYSTPGLTSSALLTPATGFTHLDMLQATAQVNAALSNQASLTSGPLGANWAAGPGGLPILPWMLAGNSADITGAPLALSSMAAAAGGMPLATAALPGGMLPRQAFLPQGQDYPAAALMGAACSMSPAALAASALSPERSSGSNSSASTVLDSSQLMGSMGSAHGGCLALRGGLLDTGADVLAAHMQALSMASAGL